MRYYAAAWAMCLLSPSIDAAEYAQNPRPLAPKAAHVAQPSTPASRRSRIEASPVLPFEEEHLQIRQSSGDGEPGPVSGVARDGHGVVYLIQRGPHANPIIAIDLTGKVLRSWGAGDFVLPHSLRVDPRDHVWAVDAGASKLIEYTRLGKKLRTISIQPVPSTGSGFRGATDLAFGPNGTVFVTDGYGNARVLVYSIDGKPVRQWGEPGTGPSQFNLPHSIQIDHGGKVYVADRENGRIQVFTKTGKLLKIFADIGRCYSIDVTGDVLWVSVGPTDQDPGAPGWLLKLSTRDGHIMGHLDVPDQRQGHEIEILPSGEPVVTAGTGLIWFKHSSRSSAFS